MLNVLCFVLLIAFITWLGYPGISDAFTRPRDEGEPQRDLEVRDGGEEKGLPGCEDDPGLTLAA